MPRQDSPDDPLLLQLLAAQAQWAEVEGGGSTDAERNQAGERRVRAIRNALDGGVPVRMVADTTDLSPEGIEELLRDG
jgi:BioD-like phosphotransacetylase family protein